VERARLVTIPFSHYCEKARWALDRGGIPFDESPHLPILSWTASIPLGKSRTVPVLFAGGEVVADSTDILRWVDRTSDRAKLFPGDVDAEVSRLEELFDRRLGTSARRLAYFHMLRDGQATRTLFAKNVPGWERLFARVATPLIGAMIGRGLGVTEEGAARSTKAIGEVFAEVERLLADGRPWLTGDRFTAADLTFAALAGPLVFPPGLEKWGLDLAHAPASLREVVEGCRATPAGRFAIRAYEEQRA
jgi:glutathione S-transferase